mgnify:CR=1 FL=1
MRLMWKKAFTAAFVRNRFFYNLNNLKKVNYD